MKAADLSLGQRLRLRESQVFIALTILIGVFAALAAVLFTLSIKIVTHFFFGISPSGGRKLLIPTVVSLLTGILLFKFFPDARGSGVPQTEAAFHLNQGRIRTRTPFGKFLTGVLCIGCGHSMGREGPSVQIGAGLASIIGRWFQLSPRRAQSLLPVASAAALSAAFNTPIAAVLFALEEIIGDMNAALLGSSVAASVAAVIVERSILGNSPVFHVPAYHLLNSMELLAYCGLGVVGGVVSLAFCKGLLRLRAWFLALPRRTRWLQPAMGGLAIGVILIFAPQVLGVGYQYVDQALNGGLLFRTMLFLCVAKLVATIISYASGNAGGIFAPTLYLGAMLGGSVGVLVHRLAPSITGDPGAYALVGMGALFAGIIRAPLTSVFMIFELTQDYQILVPLMIANLLSFVISSRFQSKSLYRALLEQDDVHLPEGMSRVPLGTWRARDIMTSDVSLIASATPIEEAYKLFAQTGVRCLPVGNDGQILGLVTINRVNKVISSGAAGKTVASIMEKDFPHAHPDHPLELAIERLRRSPGLLPVVDRRGTSHLEGVITPKTVAQFIENNAETVSPTEPLPLSDSPPN
jgi:CIC family chloride channel protein